VLGDLSFEHASLLAVDGVAVAARPLARVARFELDRADLLGERSWEGVGVVPFADE
jgi:hypothetical protein